MSEKTEKKESWFYAYLEIIKPIFFYRDSLKRLQKKLSFKHGLIALFFIAFIFSIPTDKASLEAMAWLTNFTSVLGSFLILIGILFLFTLIFKMKTNFFEFFNTINAVLALSLVLISAPVFAITYFLFSVTLKYELLSLVVFSLVPYYNYVLFGWACEVSSGLSRRKAIALAIISMTLIFIFHYLLR